MRCGFCDCIFRCINCFYDINTEDCLYYNLQTINMLY